MSVLVLVASAVLCAMLREPAYDYFSKSLTAKGICASLRRGALGRVMLKTALKAGEVTGPLSPPHWNPSRTV